MKLKCTISKARHLYLPSGQHWSVLAFGATQIGLLYLLLSWGSFCVTGLHVGLDSKKINIVIIAFQGQFEHAIARHFQKFEGTHVLVPRELGLHHLLHQDLISH